MKIAEKRKAGEILNRGGISQRIIEIATEISKGTYKEAIEKAGMIAELVDSATYDSYWDVKALQGRAYEQHIFKMLVKGDLGRDKAIRRADKDI